MKTNFFWIGIIIQVFVSITVVGILIGSISALREADREMKSHVGETVIYQKDTVDVIDHSLFHETYKLSNGQNISQDYFESLTKINHEQERLP